MSRVVRLSACALSAVACAALVACGNAPAPVEMAEQVAPASPLVGAWEAVSITPADGSPVIDPAQPGLLLFSDNGYYSLLTVNGREPRIPSAIPFEPTDEERAEEHRRIAANGGTYEISGTTVTLRHLVAKNTRRTGGYSTHEFVVDGDTLTWTTREVAQADGAVNPNAGGGAVRTFQRLREVSTQP